MLEPETVVRQLWDAINARDYAHLAGAIAERCEWMSMPLERTYIGPEAMVNGLRSFHAEFPDGKGEILELYVEGDVVIVEWRMGGTQAETKRSFSRRGCSVAQVRGGKIVSYRDYFDRLSQREQLGLNPEPVPSAR
jgi:ketosteroid isomerase-like protein